MAADSYFRLCHTLACETVMDGQVAVVGLSQFNLLSIIRRAVDGGRRAWAVRARAEAVAAPRRPINSQKHVDAPCRVGGGVDAPPRLTSYRRPDCTSGTGVGYPWDIQDRDNTEIARQPRPCLQPRFYLPGGLRVDRAGPPAVTFISTMQERNVHKRKGFLGLQCRNTQSSRIHPLSQLKTNSLAARNVLVGLSPGVVME
ncbi:hypothetical protein J6590_010223 [Homalodisca vitripennis]|nr:hypothetical protein J6590_010223 [Homalodisca vitripennis]